MCFCSVWHTVKLTCREQLEKFDDLALNYAFNSPHYLNHLILIHYCTPTGDISVAAKGAGYV